jgi:hypothetical protein
MDTLSGLLFLQLLAAQAVSPVHPMAEQSFCVREEPFNRSRPSLNGTYLVLGKAAHSGATYSGSLTITRGKNSYRLSRQIGNSTSVGKATWERCGPDKVPLLRVTYTHQADLYCSVGLDYDNMTRATCGPTAVSFWRETGLEAWFQIP